VDTAAVGKVDTAVCGLAMGEPVLVDGAGLMWDAMVNAGAMQGEGRRRGSKRHMEPERQETRDIQCSPLTHRAVGVPEGKWGPEGGQRGYIRRAFGLIP